MLIAMSAVVLFGVFLSYNIQPAPPECVCPPPQTTGDTPLGRVHSNATLGR